MFKKLFPRQERFFTLFNDAAKELTKAAHELNALFFDLQNCGHHAEVIAAIEDTADTVANTIFEYLHKTFITPFDHFDIQQMTVKLDDVLDAINGSAQRILLYQIKNLPVEIVSLGYLCIQLSARVENAISLLSSLNHSQTILQCCDEIGQIKNEAENILTRGITHLFQAENDIKELLKIKDIYERANLIIDNYEDLAIVIKSIVLEYS